mmetsp:Transcript_28156/g.52417  ORF Transcript_28156/g.52417 Transcript_28156/m.52417 type:complete len:217 (+) Transcript_28156:553-1203(+)
MEAVVAVQIPLEFCFGPRELRLPLFNLFQIKLVATSVLRPVSHAKPAELVVASPASHVIAALILLYSYMTIRAFLCVDENPICILALIHTLSVPHRECPTRQRRVTCLSADQAEGRSAATSDFPFEAFRTCYDNFLTGRSRAPPHGLTVFYKRAQLVSLELLMGRRSQLGHNILGDYLMASRFGTSRVQAPRPFCIDCRLKVGSPARNAVAVPTFH